MNDVMGGPLPTAGGENELACSVPATGSAASDPDFDAMSIEQLRDQARGWFRTAQTSDREVAWLRKALKITTAEESAALRDKHAEPKKSVIEAIRSDLDAIGASSMNALAKEEAVTKRLMEVERALEGIAGIADDYPDVAGCRQIVEITQGLLYG